MSTVLRCTLLAAALLQPATAQAAFHFMQVEQVTGGLFSDPTLQVIQLRLRSTGQNQVQFSRVRVFDAAGLNPITIIDIPTSVANNSGGDRVLIVSPAYAAQQPPAGDFQMTNLIPPSYLAAGRLTFEADGGSVYWSFCWGGASYTGSTTGLTDNDANGNFGPCVDGPLPLDGLQAWRFTGAFSAQSTANSTDYVLDPAVVFTNNARASGSPVESPLFTDGFED
jgi:hypothetical protein